MKNTWLARLRKRLGRFLAIVPMILAVLIVIVLVRTRSGPVKRPVSEAEVVLRTIAAPAVDLVPRVYGYGLAEPEKVWQAVVQVSGPIVFVAPQLQAGEIVTKDTPLVRIDPADYELDRARLEAALAETQARLEELTAEKQHLQVSLDIEQSSLELAEAALERRETARAKGAITPDDLDREKRTTLQQRQTVQSLRNAIGLMPARRNTLEATLASHAANLAQAKLNLARTEILAPFDCRIAAVYIEQDQFVPTGQNLFEAHGTAAVEIEAVFRPEQMRYLLAADKRAPVESHLTMETLRDTFDLSATVRVRSGDWEARWPARFDRIREVVDPRTRAIHVVAVVEQPYQQVIPGVRPALVRGMYCELELRAPVRAGSLILPRSAIHAGTTIYVVDQENRLRSRTVQIAFTQENFAVVADGLQADEIVVVSDPTPAIEGMKVATVPDETLRISLIQRAQEQEGSP